MCRRFTIKGSHDFLVWSWSWSCKGDYRELNGYKLGKGLYNCIVNKTLK